MISFQESSVHLPELTAGTIQPESNKSETFHTPQAQKACLFRSLQWEPNLTHSGFAEMGFYSNIWRVSFHFRNPV